MCIYCNTSNYRKIYENHLGPIPKDEKGRSYHIHHIDGDRKNNNPNNLQALSIQDHYTVHLSQKDHAACLRLGTLLKLTAEEMSTHSRNCQLERVKNGTHSWIKGKEYKFDKTLYDFENIETGKVVTSPQREFCEKYKLSVYGINQLVRNRTKTIYGWKLSGTNHEPNRPKGDKHPSYNPTIYSFENINTGETVLMTQYQFYTTYNLNPNSVIQLTKNNGKNLTTQGWKLSETNHYSGTKYVFENTKTGEIVEMYRQQFYETYDLNRSHVCQMIKNNSKFKTVKGWKLIK